MTILEELKTRNTDTLKIFIAELMGEITKISPEIQELGLYDYELEDTFKSIFLIEEAQNGKTND